VWWGKVEEQGWLRVDHEKMRTSEERGAWWPALIGESIARRKREEGERAD